MTETKKAIQELSADTSLLVEALRKVATGDTITYKQLTDVISRDVQKQASSNLRSAMKIVQRDYQIVFGTIRGEGLKRLDDSGKIARADDSLRKIHREADRGRKRLLCVEDMEKFTNDQKVAYNAKLSALGALHEVTKTKSLGRIEGAVAKSADKLPLAGTLQAFLG